MSWSAKHTSTTWKSPRKLSKSLSVWCTRHHVSMCWLVQETNRQWQGNWISCDELESVGTSALPSTTASIQAGGIWLHGQMRWKKEGVKDWARLAVSSHSTAYFVQAINSHWPLHAGWLAWLVAGQKERGHAWLTTAVLCTHAKMNTKIQKWDLSFQPLL